MDYLDHDELLDKLESGRVNFDFKGYLFKAINLWKLVVACISLALIVAYLINVRKQNVYQLDSLISVENDQNPFFTANTSISFNWGGVSGKVGKIITTIKTRSHNEKVVDSLQFYMQNLVEGRYHLIDIYKDKPYKIELDKSKPQVLNIPIGIRFIDNTNFEVFTEFENSSATAQIYTDKSKIKVSTPIGSSVKKYKIGQTVNLPFVNFKLNLETNKELIPGKEFFIRFLNFDSVVNSYKNRTQIEPFSKASPSVLKLQINGTNKSKLVDYLNATSAILSITELERKNLYATNTIKFIDSSLSSVNSNLKDYTDEMNDFRKENKVLNIDEEMKQISDRLLNLELLRDTEQSKINYLNSLETYLNTKTDYTNIAAPTSVGIEENNILVSVAKITELSIQRQNLEYTAKEGNILFKDLDRQIESEKNVLLETINATKNTIRAQLSNINRNVSNFESKLSGLPEDQQNYLKIQRKLDISQEAYNLYLAKRTEAAIVKAANISDITVIDEAKDIGEGLIGPNKSLNYMMALMVGFFLPMFFIFILFLLDNTIHGSDEVARLSKIPILGLLGKYKHRNNLVVFEKPKSTVAESFRAIRSSLQFIFNQEKSDKGRTLMITSSVSGEGKTFCSINIATVYALSGKRTILLGLDLRKPKIFSDFEISNDVGMVNYLINDKTLDEVIFKTQVENLSIVPSGPIPPNPSELLMSNKMSDVISQLREDYDIIVLDTPPLGLVTDALELTQYADASIFMIRLDYTKKGMLQLINAKYKAGEVKNISFVLNFYKHKTNHNYGYGYGYGYGLYGDAYHENNEGPSLLERIKKIIGL